MGGKRFFPTEDEINDILTLYKQNQTIAAIAEKYQVSPTPITKILKSSNASIREKGEGRKIVFVESIAKEIAHHYKNGKTARQIGYIYGVSHNIILRSLEQQGINDRRFKFSKEEEADICRKYLAGFSMARIASEFKTNPVTIQDYLRRNNVVTRTISEAKGGLPLTFHTEVCNAYKSGEAAPSIAQRHHISPTTVYGILKKGNIYIRNLSESQGGIPKGDHEFVIQRYLDGESTYVIAEDYGLTSGPIRKILLDSNISLRAPGETLRLRTGPAPNRKFKTEEELEICRQYTESKKSSSEIAFDFGITSNGILSILERNGIPRRTTSESNLLKPFSTGWDSLLNLTREIPGNFLVTQVYVYSVSNHPDILKIGIARNHATRASTSAGVYDQCIVNWFLQTRREARLIEAAVLQTTIKNFYCPDELTGWAGWSELRRISIDEVTDLIQFYIDDLAEHCAEGGSIWSWGIANINMTEKEKKFYESLHSASEIR